MAQDLFPSLIALVLPTLIFYIQPRRRQVSSMVHGLSQKVYDWCHNDVTVSSEYAKNTSQSPGEIVKRLYGEDMIDGRESHLANDSGEATPDDLRRTSECGNWGDTQPSALFQKIYHDVLCTLEDDPLMGLTSPPLMGSSGVIPLTIIAPLPDICRHMSNLIARAEHEVFLATNYWQASEASALITNALRELSDRAGKRGKKVVVKIMYDRGNVKQVIDNHQPVNPEEYTGPQVQLPAPEEVPNIDLQVVNYHRPIFGTFHAKFMVVDRRIAVIGSNNIQDNDNLEMAIHLEGAIVDSFYDVALISWHNAFNPPLPCAKSPAALSEIPCLSHNGSASESIGQVVQAGNALKEALPEHTHEEPHYDDDIPSEAARMQSAYSPREGESKMAAISRRLNLAKHLDYKATAPECPASDEMVPYITHPPSAPFPIAMVCRKPWGAPSHACVHTPQNGAFLSALRSAKHSVFIQTPDLNAQPLLTAIPEAVRRGIEVTYYVCLGYNDAGELLPFQGGTNEMVASKLCESLSAEERKRLRVHYYVAKDQIAPIHNKFKARSCHIKLMVVDGHVGIMGNGNQDTQSWYHSAEVNVMVDSREVCEAWMEGIRRNQNTELYGRASEEDGIWRDAEGKEAEGAIGKDPGRFSWAKGVVGAVQRVRGAGGF